ncbi:MAG TPA: hypothetical protein VHY08_18825 [Bacillota bacterium]|nr:hypothetical protein [Bacillota bacterium]
MMQDLFRKFDRVKLDCQDRISSEDQSFGAKLQQEFTEFVTFANSYLVFLNQNVVTNDLYNSKELITEMEKVMKKKTNDFITKIVWHFEKAYAITLNSEKVSAKYNHEVTFNQIVVEIFEQIGGYELLDKAAEEIKAKLCREIRERVNVKNCKVSIDVYPYLEYTWDGRGLRIFYQAEEKLRKLFRAITHFDDGRTIADDDLTVIANGESRPEEYWFKEQAINGKNKLQGLRFYKNGRIDIRFTSTDQALQFAQEYCGYLPEFTAKIA